MSGLFVQPQPGLSSAAPPSLKQQKKSAGYQTTTGQAVVSRWKTQPIPQKGTQPAPLMANVETIEPPQMLTSRRRGSIGQSSSFDVFKRYAQSLRDQATTPQDLHGRRRNSQSDFAEKGQTIIVYDWDDTLFPTSFLMDQLKVDWNLPMGRQPTLDKFAKQDACEKIADCEAHAMEILQRSVLRGHVIVVTLARKGWVGQACRLFYPKVGEFLQSQRIPIIYAADFTSPAQKKLLLSQSGSDEAFYGIVKGRAISEEIDKFYSQYEGQTWKNVLSIGDSRFERYGLLAASTAYMQGRRLSTWSDSEIHTPHQQDVWEKIDGNKVTRLRVKCCKLVDQPNLDEFTIQLHMVAHWLHMMVTLDAGFDLELEALCDQSQISIAEEVLRGERPPSDLPQVAETE
eukprot:CAMPEP_0117514392 /NCGR_PEP_ID=MMETSP0784-20121206/30045_1 /TAXON_ID=39447 /ORGANISM="" /LENGTH=399 /DNA_ID=CAMNT_0005310185 /DNA_START=29 /DNA_END=1228 /DNA_ORIENTATION=+